MTVIDDIEAKRTAKVTLLAAAFTAIIASEYLWRPLLGMGINPLSSDPMIDEASASFFLLCAGLLFLVALCCLLLRQRVAIASDGVRHFPAILYRRKDYRWQDVSCWGLRTTLERDDSDRDAPITRFYVTLKSGETIEEPAFCNGHVASALENQVGKRLDIGPES